MQRRPRWPGSGCSRPTSQPETSTRIRPPSRAPAPSVIAGRIIPSSTSGGRPLTRESVIDEEDGSFISDHGESCASCHEGRGGAQGVGGDRQLRRARYRRRRRSPGCHLRRLPRPPQRPVRGSAPLFHLRAQLRGQSLHEVPYPALRAHRLERAPCSAGAPCSRAPRGTGRPATTPPRRRRPTAIRSENPRLCAGCHVNNFEVEDRLDPGETISARGHLFLPDPLPRSHDGRAGRGQVLRLHDDDALLGGVYRLPRGCRHHGGTCFASHRANIATLADLIWTDTDGDQVLFEANENGTFTALRPRRHRAPDPGPDSGDRLQRRRRLAPVSRRERCSTCS